jgi:hypothetical protein
MEDAAKKGVVRAAKDYGYELGDVTAERVSGFLEKLRNLPTAYFEAKILREVDLAEFAGAVVPEGVNPKVIEALQARGVTDIKTYKKGDEVDRKRAIADAVAKNDKLLFSRDRKASEDEPTTSYNQRIAALKDLITCLKK